MEPMPLDFRYMEEGEGKDWEKGVEYAIVHTVQQVSQPVI
jgi:hypothetical protein